LAFAFAAATAVAAPAYAADLRVGLPVGPAPTPVYLAAIYNSSGLSIGGRDGVTQNASTALRNAGARTYSFNNLTANDAAVGSLPPAINSQTHFLTLGLNYRFNWGGGTPVARY
jgi:hypothetical protein